MWAQHSWENVNVFSAKRASDLWLGQWQTGDWVSCYNPASVPLQLNIVLLVNTFGAKGSVATWHVKWAGHSDESELFAADGTSWRLNSRNSIKKKMVSLSSQ
jgi:hypothetical protein